MCKKNFMRGLQNAKNILNSLERSLQKTKKYEKKLTKCRASHSHLHDINEWWESDVSEEKSKCTLKSSRSQVDLAESWSTMSIVCLQYQYEELSKRYSSLLQAYNERCSSLSARETALGRLRQRVRTTHERLAHAHRTLLMIGEKYLALRDKRIAQKAEYEEKISQLRRAVCEVVAAAERARLELDAQIADSMAAEKDAATALLLDESVTGVRIGTPRLRCKHSSSKNSLPPDLRLFRVVVVVGSDVATETELRLPGT
ncbi:uncharacterized protein LOC126372654 [Pectinophora gossypiella]|uniref:uncharacterized protein LOC126372654 n=1 Tax=Pectinophora gossypiella TaxID=13191 RepID=UPI00214E0325|nr:uncharacterized protein LOC126372654 [Pectinophora gossypiella]